MKGDNLSYIKYRVVLFLDYHQYLIYIYKEEGIYHYNTIDLITFLQ